MKRASYREAIAWIALNESPADGADQDAIASYMTTHLVADMFGTSDSRVAEDVARARMRHAKQVAL
jgi:hypothetical protein